jgi:NADH-quinone oxidoreductase subunit E
MMLQEQQVHSPQAQNLQRVNEIIDSYDADRIATLAILQDIQAEYNYLPREALIHTADRLGIPLGEVYRMATFFRAFSLEPRGEFTIKVCLGTACHVRGAVQILEQFERDLKIKAGETTSDGKFSLEVVMCLGACALGPVVLVNEDTHGEMSPDKAQKLVASLKEARAPQLAGAESSGQPDSALEQAAHLG